MRILLFRGVPADRPRACVRLVLPFLLLFLFSISNLSAGVALRLIYDATPLKGRGSDVKSSPLYPDKPTREQVLTNNLGSNPPDYTLEEFGDQIRGYLEPPETGDYIFTIHSDDQAEFHLSTDESEANLVLVVEEPACCSTWDDPNRSSSPVRLEEGKRYYFEIDHVDAYLGDYVHVGWRRPSGLVERPIPALYIAPFPIDLTTHVARETAPFILTTNQLYHGALVQGQPQSQTVTPGEKAFFSVTYEATFPVRLQWRRNGTPIPGATHSWLEVPNISVTNNGDRYDVVIGNRLNTITSDAAILNGAVAPSLVSTRTFGNTNGVDLQFSVDLDPVLSVDASHYAVSNGVSRIPVTAAAVVAPGIVRLTVPTPEGFAYTVQIQGLKTRAGADIPLLNGSFIQAEGFMLRQIFTGQTDPTAFFNGGFNTEPALVDYAPLLEGFYHLGDSGPLDSYFGTRIQGYLTPPVTGDYLFFVSADDNATFYLSPNEDPAGKSAVISTVTWSYYRNYLFESPAASQKVTLTAGKKYYFEVLHYEGQVGDHVEIAWQMPGGPPVTNRVSSTDALAGGPSATEGTPGIAGQFLTAFGKHIGPVSITSPPQGARVEPGAAATFRVGVDGALPYSYQWNRDGQPIPGATNATYAATGDVNTPHEEITVTIRNRFSAITSDAAPLDVNVPSPPRLTLERSANSFIVRWDPADFGAMLETSSDPAGPWNPIPESVNDIFYEVINNVPRAFFRLKR